MRVVYSFVHLLHQADELSSQRVELSAEELREAARRERVRLEEAGEIDRVGDSLGKGADAAPAFDSLVGKTIEVRWRYWETEDGKRKQAQPITYHDLIVCMLLTCPALAPLCVYACSLCVCACSFVCSAHACPSRPTACPSMRRCIFGAQVKWWR